VDIQGYFFIFFILFMELIFFFSYNFSLLSTHVGGLEFIVFFPLGYTLPTCLPPQSLVVVSSVC